MSYKLPLEITIKDIPNTESVESRIERKAQKLTQFSERIEFCKVLVCAIQKHQHQGRIFTIHIEVNVPHALLVVNRHQGENLYLVIRDAFASMKRKLEEYTRKQKGRIKKHPSLFGTIVRLYDDYGFIESPGGNEYYFHAVNLANTKFEELSIGLMVHFTEVSGGDGLQANHVISLDAKETAYAKAA